MIAIDGRALRQSFLDVADRSPLHLVHAFAAENWLLLGWPMLTRALSVHRGPVPPPQAFRA